MNKMTKAEIKAEAIKNLKGLSLLKLRFTKHDQKKMIAELEVNIQAAYKVLNNARTLKAQLLEVLEWTKNVGRPSINNLWNELEMEEEKSKMAGLGNVVEILENNNVDYYAEDDDVVVLNAVNSKGVNIKIAIYKRLVGYKIVEFAKGRRVGVEVVAETSVIKFVNRLIADNVLVTLEQEEEENTNDEPTAVLNRLVTIEGITEVSPVVSMTVIKKILEVVDGVSFDTMRATARKILDIKGDARRSGDWATFDKYDMIFSKVSAALNTK